MARFEREQSEYIEKVVATNRVSKTVKGGRVMKFSALMVIGEKGAGRVLLKPAAPGTGVIAGGPVRIIMEAAGIKDIRTKCLRTNTAVNVVAATFEGLKALRTPEEVARTRGKSVDEIVG